jgi:hypothetical protein
MTSFSHSVFPQSLDTCYMKCRLIAQQYWLCVNSYTIQECSGPNALLTVLHEPLVLMFICSKHIGLYTVAKQITPNIVKYFQFYVFIQIETISHKYDSLLG